MGILGKSEALCKWVGIKMILSVQGIVLFISAVLRLAGAREEVPERHSIAGGVGAHAHRTHARKHSWNTRTYCPRLRAIGKLNDK